MGFVLFCTYAGMAINDYLKTYERIEMAKIQYAEKQLKFVYIRKTYIINWHKKKPTAKHDYLADGANKTKTQNITQIIS